MSLLLSGGPVLTCQGDDLGLIANGAVLVQGDTIEWVGDLADLPSSASAHAESLDTGGKLITPGLVDCHAHPIFAGNRANEFAMRSEGRDYQEIAAAGGGITATLGPTRLASTEELVAGTRARALRALSWGTTTLEAKSGYDLTFDGELRMLRVARQVGKTCPVDIVTTLLGAHLIPPEYAGRRQQYVERVCEMIDSAAAEGLADAVDVYCDQGAFDLRETRQILSHARDRGLPRRAHIGQFADLGGAQLLAELGALSGDHLEQVSAQGIAALAEAQVVAVMLPGACVQLRMQPPPVQALRAAGVKMAVATDMNPGTSYAEPLPLQMWLAATHYGMTVDEAWLGVTRYAAKALGRDDRGVLAAGKRADLVIWDASSPADIPYHYGANLVHQIVKDGRPLD